jgi:hypothetical protein
MNKISITPSGYRPTESIEGLLDELLQLMIGDEPSSIGIKRARNQIGQRRFEISVSLGGFQGTVAKGIYHVPDVGPERPDRTRVIMLGIKDAIEDLRELEGENASVFKFYQSTREPSSAR